MTHPPDPIWDAVVKEFKYSAICDSIRGNLNKAVKQFKQLGATPEEIRKRKRNYVRVMPKGCLCTPLALAKHWNECGQEGESSGNSDKTLKYLRDQREYERLARLEKK